MKESLTSEEAKELQLKYGKNELVVEKKETIITKIHHVVKEPMFLLLILAAIIYFILGEPRDGAIMLIFVIGIISIDIIQEWKTDRTLNALKDLSAPRVVVIRDGVETSILSSDIVPGDLMMIYEGVKIPADGVIIRCNDLCVDESTLTGEAVAVFKSTKNDNSTWRSDYVYAGTLVLGGSACVKVSKIGLSTEYGKIGKFIGNAPNTPTPLQKQNKSLVKTCSIIALILFILVGLLTFINISDHKLGERIIESILSGITLAMAMIPEEFPVVLTVFLSMGAWRLAKKNSLVRKLPSVETLGAISVLCVDKTGTITENKMRVQEIIGNKELTKIMGLACETDTYDPMEVAILEYCYENGINKEELFKDEFIKEYPFTNELKMMGHVWKNKKEITIACKGSIESILSICENYDSKIEEQALEMSKKGLRVIGIASKKVKNDEDIPNNITDCKLELMGIIGLEDPPRKNIKKDIKTCNKAGIRVVMITGDNGITAASIASKIGIDTTNIITGNEIDAMTDSELRQSVKEVSIFSRVVPEHKMRIIKAFKENDVIVAMTGDGVNDAPALKYADIGIAMGMRGSEVSREAADLILMDDNFTTIVETIKDGRRIYDNIRKAIGYIFAIHVPIALCALMCPLLGIEPSSIFLLPIHVVLLELVIDPTCSIVLERQPAEDDIMDRKPRNHHENILSKKVLIKGLLQGLIIFIGAFTAYYLNLENVEIARSMGLSIIIISNLFLVNVNSSDTEFVYKTITKLAKDKVMWATVIGTILMLLIILYTPLSSFLKLHPLSLIQLIEVISISFISVIWYEIIKLFKK